MARKTKEQDAVVTAVRLRALLRGFDGLIIRNAGEVFHLPVSAMVLVPAGAPVPTNAETKQPRETVDADGVRYLVPRWCEKVGEKETVRADAEMVKGHKTAFKPGDEDVI